MPTRTPDALAWLVEQGERRVLGPVRRAHLAAADRVLTPVPALQRAHDALASGAYGTASLGLRGSAAGLRALADRGVGARLDERAPRLLAALDALDPDISVGPALTLRASGRDVPPEPDRLAAAHPAATGHLVVLVHGLLEHDGSWQPASGRSYADAAREAGATPVLVRHASGRPVGATGRELSRLLESLVGAWPVAVTRVTLVGHGAGGRVVQAAGRHGIATAADWPHLVGDVVLLGEPESGAPGEKLARLAGPLRHAPTRALPTARGRLLVGTLGPHGWTGQAATAPWGEQRQALAPLSRAVHHVVRRPGHPLLHDPDVARLLAGWLTAPPPAMLGRTPTEGEAPHGRA